MKRTVFSFAMRWGGCATIALSLLGLSGVAHADYLGYSNVTTTGGLGYLHGGSETGITTLVADDITPIAGSLGKEIVGISWTVANFDTSSFTARARIRLYAADGAGGNPGTFLGGITFTPQLFAASSITTFAGIPAAGSLFIPTTNEGKFWAGITFDNGDGSTATNANLNNLGQGVYGPPTIGSSTDLYFQTTEAGSFAASNPGGTTDNFGGSPVANFGWSFTLAGAAAVPEANSALLVGAVLPLLGGWVVLRRRKTV